MCSSDLKWITGIGFRLCASDPCLFVCTKGTERLLVGCYVDDDVMVSTSEGLSEWYRREFAKAFQESPDRSEERRVGKEV